MIIQKTKNKKTGQERNPTNIAQMSAQRQEDLFMMSWDAIRPGLGGFLTFQCTDYEKPPTFHGEELFFTVASNLSKSV